MDRMQAVPNAEPFDCSICMTGCTIGEGIIIRECLHVFCKNCLMHLVEHSSECIVKCPFVNDELSGCDGFIQEREIRGILSEKQFEGYMQRMHVLSLNMVPNSFACRTVNCKGYFIVEPNDLMFLCNVCHFENCLKCKVWFFVDSETIIRVTFVIFTGNPYRSYVRPVRGSTIRHNGTITKVHRKYYQKRICNEMSAMRCKKSFKF